MSPERASVFLARRSYRRRRLADAARLLPIAGAVLFCIPLLWRGADGAIGTNGVMFYIFGLWIALAVISGVISGYLRPSETEAAPPAAEET